MRIQTQRIAIPAAAIAVTLMAGCMVKHDKHGDSDNVTIATPLGGMQVKTNNQVALENLGIAVYPGAQPDKQEDNNGAVDVNMGFAGYQLRVKVASYRSNDSEDKVEAFYRNELKRYGDVIACHQGKPVGTPVKTLEGLTCADGVHTKVNVDGEDQTGQHKLELKTGSKRHQHVVGIDDEGSGTKFALVALDLPQVSDGE